MMFMALRVVDCVGREYATAALDLYHIRPTMRQVTIRFVHKGRIKLASPSGTIDGLTVALVVPVTRCPTTAAATGEQG